MIDLTHPVVAILLSIALGLASSPAFAAERSDSGWAVAQPGIGADIEERAEPNIKFVIGQVTELGKESIPVPILDKPFGGELRIAVRPSTNGWKGVKSTPGARRRPPAPCRRSPRNPRPRSYSQRRRQATATTPRKPAQVNSQLQNSTTPWLHQRRRRLTGQRYRSQIQTTIRPTYWKATSPKPLNRCLRSPRKWWCCEPRSAAC